MFRPRQARDTGDFSAEVARLNAARMAGDTGRLRDLFDFLAARGPDAPSASQAEIADGVFGQISSDGDDATARVYIHRLRKRLEEFYDREGAGDSPTRLVIPAGSYTLRLAGAELAEAPPPGWSERLRHPLAIAALAALVAFALGMAVAGPRAPRVNAFWQPIVDSDRPLTVVVGDYYMFGELNSFDPDRSRLIRDFRIQSPTDLVRAQDEEPERYESAEDVGLTYLPLATAWALKELAPILAEHGKDVRVVAASELTAQTLRDSDVVYVGLVSGLGLLEDVVFDRATIRPGETYDEFDDSTAGQRYSSEEMRNLASPVYYRDYGYFARLRAPGGGWVAVVAGARDTALRGIAPVMAAGDLPPDVAALADDGDGVEGLFQVTGQQGADLSHRLLAVRARR